MANDASLRWLAFVSLTASPCTALISSDVMSAQASFALALMGAGVCVPAAGVAAVGGAPEACGDAPGCAGAAVCSVVVCVGAPFVVCVVFEFEEQAASVNANKSESRSSLTRI